MFKNIPPPDLGRLLPNTPAVENLIEDGIEWFSNQSGSLLGTITNSMTGWKFAVFKQDTKGDFHVRKVMNSFLNLKAARAELLLSMAEFEMIDWPTRGGGSS
jgi:hypothetical protein